MEEEEEEDGYEDVEGRDFSGHFNVGIETLLTKLFPIVGGQMMTSYEIGGHLDDTRIWCSPGRAGFYQLKFV